MNYHTTTRCLRSANTNLLSVPRVGTTFASRGFSVAAPTVWNSLPSGIRNSSSTHTFRRLLKTHLKLRLPLAAHPSATDSATGWHCALFRFIYLLTYLCVVWNRFMTTSRATWESPSRSRRLHNSFLRNEVNCGTLQNLNTRYVAHISTMRSRWSRMFAVIVV